MASAGQSPGLTAPSHYHHLLHHASLMQHYPLFIIHFIIAMHPLNHINVTLSPESQRALFIKLLACNHPYFPCYLGIKILLVNKSFLFHYHNKTRKINFWWCILFKLPKKIISRNSILPMPQFKLKVYWALNRLCN